MKNVILKILVFLVSFSGFSQNITTSGNSSRNSFFNNNLVFFKSKKLEYSDIQGTPYINKGYYTAKVNDLPDNVTFRYNAYKDIIEISANNRTYALSKQSGNRIKSNEISYAVYKDNEVELNRFFKEELVLKSVQLLKKQVIKYQAKKEALNTYGSSEPAKFKRLKDVLYISFSNNKAEKLPKSKKKFYALFGDKKNQIKAFMKKNGLKHKKEKDVIKVLNHYVTL